MVETLELRQLLSAAAVITEVHPSGSSAGYGSDWFEITNRGPVPLDISGWKVDDSSNAIATALALRGVTSIPAGKSAVFIEALADGSTDPAKVAAFSTAWFGSATPPADVLIGTYGGSGIGLSGSGDAVNLFNAAGSRVTGVTFAAATTGVSFDNTAGGVAVSTLSAAGANGAFSSSTGGETGSPGTYFNPALPATIDLSLYVRTGRFNLPVPPPASPPAANQLAVEVSTVTYNWDTDTLFILGDEATSIVQVSKTGALIDTMPLAAGDFADPEGLTYVGGGKFVLAEERLRQLNLLTYTADTTLARSAVQSVKLGTTVGNIGLEGLSYDPKSGGFIVVKEKDPQGVFQTTVDFAAGTASNGSPSSVNSTDLFDPTTLGLVDIADVYALSNLVHLSAVQNDNLLVLSQESAVIRNVSRTGVVANSLTIVADSDNPLTAVDQGHEGVAMDRDGKLYVVSEQGGGPGVPQLWVYEKSAVPNAAPTALTLSNQTNALAENTSTANRLKVADVAVTDDGLGTNVLTLSGADASSFEVDSTGLYIKAGTTLDFESQTSYSATVNVDDASVGNTPDATASYSLSLTDVVDETVVIPSIVITEVAPWSSGDSPFSADWFEITNTGTTDVSLAGWKWDDDSNSFASGTFLSGVNSIAPGQSVVFVDGTSTTVAAFKTSWFGANVPAGFAIGTYSGPGLGTGGDSVNLFDAGGNRVTGISVGTSTVAVTFDNSAGAGSTTLPLPSVGTLSVAGTNGAFVAADTHGTGSPGTITTVVPPPLPTIAVDDVTLAEGNTGLTPFVFTVSRSSDVGTASVKYTTAYGNVNTSAADLAVQSGTVNFVAGEISKSVTIYVNGDTAVETENVFYLDLSDAIGATIADARGVGTIVNDDGLPPPPPPPTSLPSLLISNVSKAEGNSGLTPFVFTVTRTGNTSAGSSVKWQTTYGNASTSSADLAFHSGTVQFAAGQLTAQITVYVKGDIAVETDNLFFVDLFAPTGAVIGDSRGSGTIVNDDGVSPPPTPPAGPTLSISNVVKAEGNSGKTSFVFQVIRSSAVGTAFATWSTSFGTAGATDLAAQNGTVFFAAGQTTRAVIVYVNGDTAKEGPETFFVNLANPANATILDGQGLGTIQNDD